MAQTAFTANLVAPVDLKFAASGKAVAKGRVAENHRGKNQQTGEWEDQGTSWRNIVAFGAQAEKLAEVAKGTTLVIIGRESSRAYSKDGEDRQWTEVAIDAFGIAPRGQSQQPPRTPNAQGEGWGAQNAQQSQWPSAQPAYGNDPVPF